MSPERAKQAFREPFRQRLLIRTMSPFQGLLMAGELRSVWVCRQSQGVTLGYYVEPLRGRMRNIKTRQRGAPCDVAE